MGAAMSSSSMSCKVATHTRYGRQLEVDKAQSFIMMKASQTPLDADAFANPMVILLMVTFMFNVAQLTLCGQTPETAMTAALASVNFYVGQLELQAQLRESQVQRKISKVQEACKSKLQEVHNGYTQVAATTDSASYRSIRLPHSQGITLT